MLKSDGFEPNPVDQCMWNKGMRKEQTTIAMHVDDLKCTARRFSNLKKLEKVLAKAFKY